MDRSYKFFVFLLFRITLVSSSLPAAVPNIANSGRYPPSSSLNLLQKKAMLQKQASPAFLVAAL